QAVDHARSTFHLELETELQRARGEIIVARRQTEARDLPSDESRLTCEAHSRRASHLRATEEDALLRQPFEARVFDGERLILPCNAAFRTIKLRRGRRRDQHIRSGLRMHANRQFVSSDDAPGRMHDIDMTDAPLWIEGTLYDQWTQVRSFDQMGSRIARS